MNEKLLSQFKIPFFYYVVFYLCKNKLFQATHTSLYFPIDQDIDGHLVDFASNMFRGLVKLMLIEPERL